MRNAKNLSDSLYDYFLATLLFCIRTSWLFQFVIVVSVQQTFSKISAMVVYTYEGEENLDPQITISVLSDKIPEMPENQLTVSTILSFSPDLPKTKEMEAENGNNNFQIV
jgi:hypothetical protein